MEFLDIAIASAYASVCLTVLVLVSPVAARQVAVEAADQSTLDSAIAAYIEHAGLPSIADAPISELCASAEAAGNSTVGFDITVEGSSCGDISEPPHPLAVSVLSLQLPGRSVEVSAWLTRP